MCEAVNKARRGAAVAGYRTLKADNVCSEFLQNGIPGLEGIPSTPSIRLHRPTGSKMPGLLTDGIEVLSGLRSNSQGACFRTEADTNERCNDKGYAQGSKTGSASVLAN